MAWLAGAGAWAVVVAAGGVGTTGADAIAEETIGVEIAAARVIVADVVPSLPESFTDAGNDADVEVGVATAFPCVMAVVDAASMPVIAFTAPVGIAALLVVVAVSAGAGTADWTATRVRRTTKVPATNTKAPTAIIAFGMFGMMDITLPFKAFMPFCQRARNGSEYLLMVYNCMANKSTFTSLILQRFVALLQLPVHYGRVN
jgi:hypothetical protein